MRRECWERFPATTLTETASQRSRHASRYVRDARAVMHVGIANLRWRRKRSGIPGACATHNCTYLVRAHGLKQGYPYLIDIQEKNDLDLTVLTCLCSYP